MAGHDSATFCVRTKRQPGIIRPLVPGSCGSQRADVVAEVAVPIHECVGRAGERWTASIL